MLFTVHRIPQLAVSAKLLCLLMVVICGAIPSMVYCVRLHHDCSSSELQINMEGRVYAAYDPSHTFSLLTLQSVTRGVVTIRGQRSELYLCFSRRWKLVGRKKGTNRMCQFEEKMEDGFNRYRSVENTNFYIGFNNKGNPYLGPRTYPNISVIPLDSKIHNKRNKKILECTRFLILGTNVSQRIDQHNSPHYHNPNPNNNRKFSPKFIKTNTDLLLNPPLISDENLRKKTEIKQKDISQNNKSKLSKRKKVKEKSNKSDRNSYNWTNLQTEQHHPHRHSKHKNNLYIS